MRVSAITTTVAMASLSQAFLLPPQISKASDALTKAANDVISALPFDDAATIDGEVLNLKCTGCPVPVTDVAGNKLWLKDIDSVLPLNFTITHEEVDKLSLNGVQIYPSRDFPLAALTAPMVVKSPKAAAGETPQDVRIGYELTVRPVAKSVQDQLELIDVHFQVVEIADVFVDDLPSVEMKLLKTPSGKLMIGNLESGPTTNPAYREDSEQACNTLVCQFKAAVGDRISKMKPSFKGCGNKGMSNPHGPSSDARLQHHGGPPHGHGGHRHSHHAFGGLFRFLRGIAMHVLIPISIGVIAGIVTSFIGMLVGQFLVFLWRTFYRRGQIGYASIEVTDEDDDSDTDYDYGDETKSFIQHQGPPPVYEDVIIVEQKTEN